MIDSQFSLADLSLVITIVVCVLTFCLVGIARAIPAPSKTCRAVLGALFVAIAFDALAMLLIWNGSLRTELTLDAKWPIVIASLALGSKGPLLYLFTRTLTQANYTLKPRHYWHALLPIVGVALVGFYPLDVRGMTVPVEADYGIPGAFFWWTLMRAAPVAYAIAALVRLRTIHALYDSHYTGNESQYGYWIKLLVVGFLIQWAMALLTHVAGQYLPTGSASVLGKLNDFMGLILVNGLLVYSYTLIRTLTPILGSDDQEQPAPASVCTHCQAKVVTPEPAAPANTEAKAKESAAPVKMTIASAYRDDAQTNNTQAHKPAPPSGHSAIDEQTLSGQSAAEPTTSPPTTAQNSKQVTSYQPSLQTVPHDATEQRILAAINAGVTEQSLHLIHTLNIEKFSREIECPTKEVSRLINTYYGCSFSEFINAYRTMEAERILQDPAHHDSTVLEVIHLAGFNSKSAFHRFFKRFTQQSPSEYRAMLAASQRLQQSAHSKR